MKLNQQELESRLAPRTRCGPVDPADFHRFDAPDGCLWGEVTTTTANLGARINKVLGRIERAIPSTLANTFASATQGPSGPP